MAATGCATVQPTVAATTWNSAVATPPSPGEKKLHWGWTVAVLVVVAIIVIADAMSDSGFPLSATPDPLAAPTN